MKKLLRLVLTVSTGIFWGAHAQAQGALQCVTLPALIKVYLTAHVMTKELNEDMKKKAIEQYVKGLDGFKTILLEKDVKKIREDMTSLFKGMEQGNCDILVKIQKIQEERAAEIETFAKSFLNDKYVLNDKVSFVMDPDKRSYPKTANERNEFLKKYMHFQISNYLLTDQKLPEAKKLLIHRYELITKRIRERDTQKIYGDFLKSVTAAMDPHSTYMTQDEYDDFQIDMSLALDGIGAQLSSQDGFTVVEELIAGGAADRAASENKLLPKDKIIAVAQQEKKTGKVAEAVPVIDMELRDVVRLIRGQAKTNVLLTVLRQQGEKAERHVITITRDKIQLTDAQAKITFQKQTSGNKTYKLAIIELPSFYGEEGKRSSFTDMRNLLKKAAAEKADGVLLNLTRNGGGLLEDAVRISGLFLRKGNVVATQSQKQIVDVLADKDDTIDYRGPLVVLTSRLSASASEILAGALKDYKRALIVGADHTFGKGSVQAVMRLGHGLGAMKVTTGLFFLPAGASTQHAGVIGDIVIPSPLNNDEIGEKALDNSLQPQKIASFLSPDANTTDRKKAWDPVDPSIVTKLAMNSRTRLAKDAKFIEIRKDIDEAKKNKSVISLADLRKKSTEEKAKNKGQDKKSTAERIKEADAPIINEGLNILADYVSLEAEHLKDVASGATPAAQAAN